jgi:hypothetical protein
MFEKLMIVLAFIAAAAGLAYLIAKRNQRLLRAQRAFSEEKILSVNILAMRDGHDYMPEVDPYYNADDWHEAARGDGRCYGGVLDTISRLPQETIDQLIARARKRAKELERIGLGYTLK